MPKGQKSAISFSTLGSIGKMSATDSKTISIIENALSKLNLQFGWEGDRLFILDTEKITGKEMVVRAIVRPRSLQLSAPLLVEPSTEQRGVAFWQEWRRRGEATFLLLDEEGDDTELALAARLPLENLDEGTISRMIRASLGALARDRESVEELMEDVRKEEIEAAA